MYAYENYQAVSGRVRCMGPPRVVFEAVLQLGERTGTGAQAAQTSWLIQRLSRLMRSVYAPSQYLRESLHPRFSHDRAMTTWDVVDFDAAESEPFPANCAIMINSIRLKSSPEYCYFPLVGLWDIFSTRLNS